jgi:glutamyl-tRNA synthetase
VESLVRGTAEQRSLKAGPLIHATRVALTGRTTSPGLFELIVVLGREESIARLERLANFLTSRSSQIPEQKH